MTRRGVMRRTAIGVGAAATVGGGSMFLDSGPVGESEAVAPLIAAGVIGGSIAVGWAIREFNVIGSDPPVDGLGPDALTTSIIQTSRARQSSNASTFVDNRNILDGVEHNAYTDAKVAAIERLNAGETEANVLKAANEAIDSYETTVKTNLLKSWNESLNEFETVLSKISQSTGLIQEDIYTPGSTADSKVDLTHSVKKNNVSVPMPDGTSFGLHYIHVDSSHSDGNDFVSNGEWSPTEIVETKNGTNDSDGWTVDDCLVQLRSTADLSGLTYLTYNDWNGLYADVGTAFTNVRDGISTWVTNVYGQVQSGEIEITDLLTPRERAAMMTEDGKYPQAVADLIALNVPVDLEREATVKIPSTGTTLTGTFALTDSADGPLESGTTYDPSTFAGDAYLTTDISLLDGTWSAYQTAVDGGVISLSEEPYSGMVYEVETTAGETVSVAATDWADSGSGTWTYDASADLETPITEVSAVSYYAETSETQYETIQLDSEFTIEKFVNTETGEEAQSTTFTNSEPQTDSNYITQEEWDSLEKQNQELIEKYEESQTSGGGGGGFLSGSGDAKTLGIVAGGAALAALLFGNN
ncbi:hypothetical protein HRPV13_gp04 [Halorubrum pleomorphic virus 13]|nr:hypothetical protein HRPV13_gp04 [Halorubrum pleomorphic virus 13]